LFFTGESTTQKVACPDPFVNPLDENHPESCIKPCPVHAYDLEEYTLMWQITCSLGIISILLNSFMSGNDPFLLISNSSPKLVVSTLGTWAISKKAEFASTPYQLKYCVFASLLYGVVETLPSLFLKYDLPCGCETEEWCVSVSTLDAVLTITRVVGI
jgi:hypothetical protein